MIVLLSLICLKWFMLPSIPWQSMALRITTSEKCGSSLVVNHTVASFGPRPALSGIQNVKIFAPRPQANGVYINIPSSALIESDTIIKLSSSAPKSSSTDENENNHPSSFLSLLFPTVTQQYKQYNREKEKLKMNHDDHGGGGGGTGGIFVQAMPLSNHHHVNYKYRQSSSSSSSSISSTPTPTPLPIPQPSSFRSFISPWRLIWNRNRNRYTNSIVTNSNANTNYNDDVSNVHQHQPSPNAAQPLPLQNHLSVSKQQNLQKTNEHPDIDIYTNKVLHINDNDRNRMYSQSRQKIPIQILDNDNKDSYHETSTNSAAATLIASSDTKTKITPTSATTSTDTESLKNEQNNHSNSSNRSSNIEESTSSNEIQPLFDACTPLSVAADIRKMKGRIAVVSRGLCDFSQKVTLMQDAGALGVIVVNLESEGKNTVTMKLNGTKTPIPKIRIPSVLISFQSWAIFEACANDTTVAFTAEGEIDSSSPGRDALNWAMMRGMALWILCQCGVNVVRYKRRVSEFRTRADAIAALPVDTYTRRSSRSSNPQNENQSQQNQIQENPSQNRIPSSSSSWHNNTKTTTSTNSMISNLTSSNSSSSSTNIGIKDSAHSRSNIGPSSSSIQPTMPHHPHHQHQYHHDESNHSNNDNAASSTTDIDGERVGLISPSHSSVNNNSNNNHNEAPIVLGRRHLEISDNSDIGSSSSSVSNSMNKLNDRSISIPGTSDAINHRNTQISSILDDDDESDDDDGLCAICLEEFEEGQEVRHLECGHLYHRYCIDPWLQSSSNCCPLCKREVPNLPPPPTQLHYGSMIV